MALPCSITSSCVSGRRVSIAFTRPSVLSLIHILVILRAAQGTLWVTSSPAGAAITINGKRFPQTTPAQIPLPPGAYRVLVEKDGAQNTSALEIRNGQTKVLKVSLNQ